MSVADVLTFREFVAQEPLPLSTVQQAVLEFLRGRDDTVVCDAQAVNAYVAEPRMTQDLDLLSTRAQAVAEEVCAHLKQRFHIALRIRKVGSGGGLRIFQVRKPANRHLVAVRPVPSLPGTERIAGVLVLAPPDLIASKVIAYHQRRGQPKAGIDWRDLAELLLVFPDLKRHPGPVTDRLGVAGASPEIVALWQDLVAREIRAAGDDGY